MRVKKLSNTFSILFLCLFALIKAEIQDPNGFLFPKLNGSLVEVDNAQVNIHIIAHTHDDIGWLKTIDQYYFNQEKQITHLGVQYIFDTLFPVLQADPTKKFIYVEVGFFQRWWDEQNDATKAMVKKFVQNGQFEFINGGYCMNDEAAVYYEDSIDQMGLGHKFLLETFNVIPTVGWHIDPFGHASAQASLFAQMGFNSFFVCRLDYQDKTERLKNQGMEMVWIPNTSQGIENAIFTHSPYFEYGAPANFDFDIFEIDEPINDNPYLQGYNLPQRADEFMAWFRLMQSSYKSTNLMHTAGEDFHYQAAQINFKNYDKLFNYIKKTASYNANIIYSTPSQYIKAINPLNLKYPEKYDDFFPYANVVDGYWTGYFTSRTSIKGLVRREGRLLQAAKRLFTQLVWQKSSSYVTKNFAKIDKAFYKLEEASAIGQHHDAVTGTEKTPVADDYKLRYAIGENAVKNDFLYPYFQEKIQADLKISSAQLSTCMLNTSAVFCDVTYKNLGKGTPVLVTIYNSGQVRNSAIRIKVPNGKVQVLSASGSSLSTDVICSNSTDTSDCDLFFTAEFAAFSTSYYYLKQSDTSNQVTPKNLVPNEVIEINSKQTITTLSMSSFLLTMCQDSSKKSCATTQFNLKYNYYESYQAAEGQQSGAYIFRPSTKTWNSSLSYAQPQSASVYRGKNLIQIHLSSTNIIADLRIYNELAKGVELQTFVNSISITDNQGKEIVLIVEAPGIKNNQIFYTDSMGMELQKRVLNYRPTWKLQVNQPIAGNYYPIQSQIMIKDITSSESLAIVPDRAQGGTSLYGGQLELMLHRRILKDDNRGLNEALNETDWDGKGMRQWVTHTLVFNKPGYLESSYRQVQKDNDIDNIILLAPTTKTPFFDSPLHEIMNIGAFGDFGSDIKLLSKPLAANKFLLRFQNMNEAKNLTVPTSVFSNTNFGVNAQGKVVEMSLTANQPKKDMIKKRFNWNGLDLNNPKYALTDYLDSDRFALRTLEIRTFVVEFNSNLEEESILL